MSMAATCHRLRRDSADSRWRSGSHLMEIRIHYACRRRGASEIL